MTNQNFSGEVAGRVEATSADIRFPVLTFTTDVDVWRIASLDVLTTCGPRTLKDDMQAGMEIVDSELRRWVVRSVRRTGRARSFLPWLFASLLTATPQYRIEQMLEPLSPLSLDQVRARVAEALNAHPDYWVEGEQGVASLLADLRTAGTVAEINALLGPDDFRGY